MKKFLSLFILAAIFFIANKAIAQCNFTPTIIQGNIIFCPYATDTLSTQVYDTYQWYKNNKPIAGATSRSLIIHQQEDQGYLFKVAVTKNGCHDTSKKVYTDGYAFTPIILIETGDIGVYNPRLDALQECPEDTLILTAGGSVAVNFQWYNALKPIPGANDQSYYVTKTGSYTVCGAPEVCPDYIECESLPLNAYFETPVATITRSGDSLIASKAKTYQWYLLNKKIPGAVQQYYVPKTSGIYKVMTEDKYTCTALSDPYHFKLNKNLITVAPNPVKDVLHVHVNAADARQIIIVDLYGNQKIKMQITGNDQNIAVNTLNPGTYILQIINAAGMQISSATLLKQ